ncbi:hypothetical protein [Methylobacter tundripaludum]|uniref:hypothetical protein n=1 Tax=Methylobacter tundripaludum TaxID=173365 RepID=UPI0012373A81|nr:hypothetical protein [Methylobacter tundripaludum]
MLKLIRMERTFSPAVGRNKSVRAAARTGVSGKHLPNSPETPPRATRLDGLIPAYAIAYLD